MEYRPLKLHEIVQAGDVYDAFAKNGQPTEIASSAERRSGGCVGNKVDDNNWYRPVTHDWIKFSDRQPTEVDANKAGEIVVYYAGYKSSHIMQWNFNTEALYWMPLAFFEEKPAPVKVDGRELIPQKNGDVKISCGTVIPAKDVDEFIRQRQEAMK